MAEATVTGLTAERMLEIEASSVVDGEVVDGSLTLKTRGGEEIEAGFVRGTAVVHHGTNANAPRPDSPLVYWVGTAIPVNGLAWDYLLRENV